MVKDRKRRSPREIIESANPKLEHAYLKFPGQELIDVSLPGSEGNKEVTFDTKQIESLYDKYKHRYSELHTHPKEDAVPSAQDISGFLDSKNVKTMVVANVDENTGKLKGYFFLRKRNRESVRHLKYKEGQRELEANIPKNKGSKRLFQEYKQKQLKRRESLFWRLADKLGFTRLNYALNDDSNFLYPIPKSSEEERERVLDLYNRYMLRGDTNKATEIVSDAYNLDKRIIPAEGYYFEGLVFKEKSLENKVATVILGLIFLVSILFLSSNLTGFAVYDFSIKNSNVIGVILFLIGLIGTFFYFSKKKLI